jgi:putative ABC transport system permease protein
MKSAYENKLNDFGNVDPDTVVSDVLINVDGEHNVEEVVNDINLHVKNVEAIKTKDMISGIAGSLQGVSRLIGILMACVWFLAIVILMVAYRMVTNERIREFAVLRVLGVSSRKLFSLILKEGMIIGLIGALCGVTAGALIVFPFHQMIESQLGLPYLLPSTARIVGLVLMALVVTVFTGGMAAAVSANRISKMDTGLILREDQ